VLASCHSGADVAYAGDEVLGFVSAMLARGTAGVVANIAAVPDVEVVDLMVGLHRRLAAGDTMARALHAARGGIDTGPPAGFVNWCTFSAHGAA
jgi:CHAT domain-containing protein